MKEINSPADLRAFREEFGLRHDWHEPDEQEVSAVVIGTDLDNAYGARAADVDSWNNGQTGVRHCEMQVVLVQDAKPVACINLANLLAWACLIPSTEPGVVAEAILAGGARSAIRRAVGDRKPQQYDKADTIVDGIAGGVRNMMEQD